MSRLINGISIIEPEPEMICHECGKVAETRPYGKDFAEVCHDCAMKDPKQTEINMSIKLFGGSLEEATEFANKKYGEPK